MTTRNVVPNADNEGSLGTASLRWAAIRAVALYTGSIVAADGGTSLDTLSTKTTTYSLLITDKVVLCDATAGAFTVTFPTAVGCAGREYVIKKTDASLNAITLSASQGIDGLATRYLKHQFSTMHVQSNGVSWSILNKNLDSEFEVNDMSIPTGMTRSVLSGEYTDIVTAATGFVVEGTLYVEGSFYYINPS